MKTWWIALAALSMLARPACAQQSDQARHPAPWWSIAAASESGARMQGGGATAAWRLGAHYSLASATLLLGASAHASDPLARSRQLAIGYAYRLSGHATLVADASRTKASLAAGGHADYRIRSVSIGLRGAY